MSQFKSGDLLVDRMYPRCFWLVLTIQHVYEVGPAVHISLLRLGVDRQVSHTYTERFVSSYFKLVARLE